MIKVLIPFDFSTQAHQALEFATKLAEQFDSMQLVVLHVMELPVSTGYSTIGGGEMLPNFENQVFFIELMEQRKKQLAELETSYSGRKFSLTTVAKIGNAYQHIAASIEEETPDLIVMGSKGTSGMEEILIGSNTEKVVRFSQCPVITIKGPTDPSSIQKIVFASDFKDTDPQIADNVKRLQQLFDASIYLVIVNTPSNFESTRDSIKRINKFVKANQLENMQAEIYNSITEEAGILEFAEDIKADLIALSTQGRRGLLHLLTGSIAEDVVNHAPKPVWTFKSN
jgi:nucleotide-binding universal stress UspA family protein